MKIQKMNPGPLHLRMAAPGTISAKIEDNTLTGIAVPYGKMSAVLRDKSRPYREIVEPGSLKWDERTVMYTQHDHRGIPLARVGSNTLRFSESAEGLRFSASLPESRVDVREALERGDLDGSVSIGFVVDKQEWSNYGKSSVRRVTRGHLIELSIVANGAYSQAAGTFNGGGTNG